MKTSRPGFDLVGLPTEAGSPRLKANPFADPSDPPDRLAVRHSQ
jgi:hypothetical protein